MFVFSIKSSKLKIALTAFAAVLAVAAVVLLTAWQVIKATRRSVSVRRAARQAELEEQAHRQELEEARRAGYRTAVCFVIQMENVSWFEPNDRTHPAFGAALRHAAEAGVEVLAMECRVTPEELLPGRPVPVRL